MKTALLDAIRRARQDGCLHCGEPVTLLTMPYDMYNASVGICHHHLIDPDDVGDPHFDPEPYTVVPLLDILDELAGAR